MHRKLGAAFAAATLTLSIGGFAAPAVMASSDPVTPSVTLTSASCSTDGNTIKVSDLDSLAANGHRLVIEINGKPAKQIKTAFRMELAKGTKSAESLFSAAELKIAYGQKVVVKSYWFNSGKNRFDHLKNRETTVTFLDGKTLTNAVPLGASNEITLVDPTSLKCGSTTPAPKDSIADIKVPSLTLTAAMCEADKATDNVMTIEGDKAANYRFVANYDGKKVSLKEELRDKLWTNGALTASDIKAAYPTFTFDYTKPLSIQTYWFDAEKAYAPTLYDDALKLTIGESDRFIKLPSEVTLTLVDPTSLKCSKDAPAADSTPGSQKPSGENKGGTTAVSAPKVAKTGFESGLLTIAGLLTVGAAVAGVIAIRARK